MLDKAKTYKFKFFESGVAGGYPGRYGTILLPQDVFEEIVIPGFKGAPIVIEHQTQDEIKRMMDSEEITTFAADTWVEGPYSYCTIATRDPKIIKAIEVDKKLPSTDWLPIYKPNSAGELIHPTNGAEPKVSAYEAEAIDIDKKHILNIALVTNPRYNNVAILRNSKKNIDNNIEQVSEEENIVSLNMANDMINDKNLDKPSEVVSVNFEREKGFFAAALECAKNMMSLQNSKKNEIEQEKEKNINNEEDDAEKKKESVLCSGCGSKAQNEQDAKDEDEDEKANSEDKYINIDGSEVSLQDVIEMVQEEQGNKKNILNEEDEVSVGDNVMKVKDLIELYKTINNKKNAEEDEKQTNIQNKALQNSVNMKHFNATKETLNKPLPSLISESISKVDPEMFLTSLKGKKVY